MLVAWTKERSFSSFIAYIRDCSARRRVDHQTALEVAGDAMTTLWRKNIDTPTTSHGTYTCTHGATLCVHGQVIRNGGRTPTRARRSGVRRRRCSRGPGPTTLIRVRRLLRRRLLTSLPPTGLTSRRSACTAPARQALRNLVLERGSSWPVPGRSQHPVAAQLRSVTIPWDVDASRPTRTRSPESINGVPTLAVVKIGGNRPGRLGV
jgi:hypothetical protein